ncbi:sugar kinase [Roseateles sp.]|uniref:sugar kinase n=1 Tax=Roseateles sp. TaxID=1971397 RepID=UPI003BA52D9F
MSGAPLPKPVLLDLAQASAIDVAVFGECMLELSGPAFGAVRQGFGGDTLNTAVYLARCGQGRLRVHYATALGEDSLSAGLLSRWQAEGLCLDQVRRLPGRLPGLYQIEVDARGERSFHYWRQASAARSYFDQPSPTPFEAQAEHCQVLYLSGISLAILPPAGRERLLALMAQRRAQGAWVVFDSNYRPSLWESVEQARLVLDQAFRSASLALVSLDDHAALWALQHDSNAALERAKDLPCPELVIKRGAEPALLRASGQQAVWQQVPTEAVTEVVDSTAAGDAFAAAYLYARLCGKSVEQSARQGHRLAAQVIRCPGALIPLVAMP